MDANRRSEVNNQTNNGANEKGTPGAKGKTTDGPLDHTYPQGASQQQGKQGGVEKGTQQSGMGPGAGAGSGQALPGGSMQTQQTGGTGAQQGITDSHQRAMEQRSGAYGELEQPLGERAKDSGTSLRGNQQSGSMGSQQAGAAQGNKGGGQMGPGAGGQSVQRGAGMASEDRKGSQTGNVQRDTGVHQSNDVAGGLPRSPGNTGATSTPRTTHLTGAQNDADLQRTDIEGVHDSNDLGGGYPRSPGGANKLAADEKMDDDTGFSNPGR